MYFFLTVFLIVVIFGALITYKGRNLAQLDAVTEPSETDQVLTISKVAVSDLLAETEPDSATGTPTVPDPDNETVPLAGNNSHDPDFSQNMPQKQDENTYEEPETTQVPPPDTTAAETLRNSEENEGTSTNEQNGRVKFKLTAYCPCKECSGKWGSMTSTGVRAREGITIAVDPKVIPYGSRVTIEGYGTYTAEDCGVRGNQIDIYFNNHQDTVNFGVRYAYVKWN